MTVMRRRCNPKTYCLYIRNYSKTNLNCWKHNMNISAFYVLIKAYKSCSGKIKIFNKCLANPVLHLKEQILRSFILCFSHIIRRMLSIILMSSLSDPLAVQPLTSSSNCSFIQAFYHTLHLMPSGSSWSFHNLYKFYFVI